MKNSTFYWISFGFCLFTGFIFQVAKGVEHDILPMALGSGFSLFIMSFIITKLIKILSLAFNKKLSENAERNTFITLAVIIGIMSFLGIANSQSTNYGHKNSHTFKPERSTFSVDFPENPILSTRKSFGNDINSTIALI